MVIQERLFKSGVERSSYNLMHALPGEAVHLVSARGRRQVDNQEGDKPKLFEARSYLAVSLLSYPTHILR